VPDQSRRQIIMKQSKQVVVGMVGLILLLLGYSAFITVRANDQEKRLKRLESSYLELDARHRALTDTLLRAETSRVAAAEAKVMLLREGLKLSSATVSGEMRPTAIEVNSTPQGVRSK
jgi:hypothetical protein